MAGFRKRSSNVNAGLVKEVGQGSRQTLDCGGMQPSHLDPVGRKLWTNYLFIPHHIQSSYRCLPLAKPTKGKGAHGCRLKVEFKRV